MSKDLYEIASIIAIGMIGSIIYDKFVKPALLNKGFLPSYSVYPYQGGLNT